MSDHYLDNLLPDFGEYSLDSILESYRNRAAAPKSADGQEAPVQPAKAAEAIAQRSRQIVMEALGETISQRSGSSALDFDAKGLGDLLKDGEPAPEEGESAPAEEPQPPQKPRVHISPEGVITVDVDMPGEDEPAPEEEEPGEEYREESEQEPAPIPEEPFPDERPRRPVRRPEDFPPAEKPSFKERFLTPLARYFATRAARKELQKAEAANWPDPEEYDAEDEVSPQKAHKFYAGQVKSIRFRLKVSVFLCIVLAWISLRLPMAGVLGKSLRTQAGVSMILLLTVMLASLDVFVAGLRQLLALQPRAESLACISALLSFVDSALVTFGQGSSLPFCALGAFSLTAALWGEKLTCVARARTMRMVSISKAPTILAAGETDRGGRFLSRVQRGLDGVVHRTEEPDFCQNLYATATPILLLASLLLAVASSLGDMGSLFLHTFSALTAVSASFTAFLSFPLPYSMIARKLQLSGAAVAGYAGAADIGRTKRVVIFDEDLFPPGNIKFSSISILEGALVDKVISSTASLLLASGSGVSGVFMELIERRKYSLVQPEEFRIHEGGGLSARVNGEQVLVGSAGFMNLMGIRLPQNMVVKNAVCTALSGELVGVFTLDYVPVSSVQEALVTLLSGRTQPIFAIRDFNITPLMIRQLFRMPTDNFNFPPFRDRYRVFSRQEQPGPVAAVLSRPGMGPLVDAAEAGRKLYTASRAGAVISLLGTVIGMVTMFLLFRAGSYDTATAGNVLVYMFLWALPVAIIAFGQSR